MNHQLNWQKWEEWCRKVGADRCKPTVFQVLQYIGGMSLVMAPNTLNKFITTVRSMLGAWWVVQIQPEMHIKMILDTVKLECAGRVKPKVPITWDIVSSILKHYLVHQRVSVADTRGLAFLGLAYLSAARPQEVASLSYGQCQLIHSESKSMSILSHKCMHNLLRQGYLLKLFFKGKTEKYMACPFVEVPVGNLASLWLHKWLVLAQKRGEDDSESKPMFTALGGTCGFGVSESAFQAWWLNCKKYLWQNKLISQDIMDYATISCLRNGCITDIHSHQFPVAVAMRVARHRTVNTNMQYNRTLAGQGAAAIKYILDA